jgi:hypothetical protein
MPTCCASRVENGFHHPRILNRNRRLFKQLSVPESCQRQRVASVSGRCQLDFGNSLPRLAKNLVLRIRSLSTVTDTENCVGN